MKTIFFKLTVLYFKLKAQNHPLQHKYSILCKKKNIPRPLLYLLCSRLLPMLWYCNNHLLTVLWPLKLPINQVFRRNIRYYHLLIDFNKTKWIVTFKKTHLLLSFFYFSIPISAESQLCSTAYDILGQKKKVLVYSFKNFNWLRC